MTHQAEGSQRTLGMVYSFDATMVPEGWPDSYVSAADYDALHEQLQSAKASIDNAVLGLNTASAEWAKVVDENGRLREQLAAMKALHAKFVESILNAIAAAKP